MNPKQREEGIGRYKVMYTGIAGMADNEGQFTISNKKLSQDYKTNNKVLDAMIAEGVISVVKPAGGTKAGTYKLMTNHADLGDDMIGRILDRSLSIKNNFKHKATAEPVTARAVKRTPAKSEVQTEVVSEFFTLRQLNYIDNFTVKPGQILSIAGKGTINDAKSVSVTVANDRVLLLITSQSNDKLSCTLELSKLEVKRSTEELLLIPRK